MNWDVLKFLDTKLSRGYVRNFTSSLGSEFVRTLMWVWTAREIGFRYWGTST